MRCSFILVCCLLITSVAVAQPLTSLNEAKHRSPRTLRYTPDGEDSVIVNGDCKFNRALYGGHSGFCLDAMNGRLLIRPSFPQSWPYAELQTPDVSFTYKQEGMTDRYTISQQTEKPLALELHVRARMDRIDQVTVNGKLVKWEAVEPAVGYPLLSIQAPALAAADVLIEWGGEALDTEAWVQKGTYKPGNSYTLPLPRVVSDVYDPQQIFLSFELRRPLFGYKPGEAVGLRGTISGLPGHRTFFVKLQQGEFSWWQPVHIEITADKKEIEPAFAVP